MIDVRFSRLGTAGGATNDDPNASDFDRIGGAEGLRAIVDDFLDKVFDDAMIGYLFTPDKRARIRKFEYRWAALKLRKEARVIRRRADELRRTKLRRRELSFTVPIALARGGKLKSLPAESGLFALFDGEGERLYVGVATNLREQLVRLLPKSRLKTFDAKGDVRVAVCPLAASWTDLLAYRQAILARSRTALNWRLPGRDDADDAAPDESAARQTNGRAPRRRRRAATATAHG